MDFINIDFLRQNHNALRFTFMDFNVSAIRHLIYIINIKSL